LTLLSVVSASWSSSAFAQAVEYFDCQVRDPASFTAAVEQFYDAMSGGVRPPVFIDTHLWNGSNPATHSVIVIHESHQALEAFLDRIAANPGPYAQLLNSVNNVADCASEGLAVQLNAWGNTETPLKYYALYPVSTTDGARYGAALTEYVESLIDEAPGPIFYYQNRAGLEDVTNFIVFGAGSLAALNSFIDTMTASREYTTFVRSVAAIRTLHTPSQAQRIVSLGAP
jgi:hypothetical protein